MMGRKPLKEKVDAELAGSLYYFTGDRCKRGHLANRYTSKRMCVECSKEDGRAISRAMKKVYGGK